MAKVREFVKYKNFVKEIFKDNFCIRGRMRAVRGLRAILTKKRPPGEAFNYV
jgi:hypothetical protein